MDCQEREDVESLEDCDVHWGGILGGRFFALYRADVSVRSYVVILTRGMDWW